LTIFFESLRLLWASRCRPEDWDFWLLQEHSATAADLMKSDYSLAY